MRTPFRSACILAACLALPGTAAAQPRPAPTTSGPERPWSAIAAGGFSSTSPGSGAALGGALLLDLNPRVGLEFGGDWLPQRHGSDSTALATAVLLNLLPASARAVPFAAAGVAVIRASFDMDDRALLGRMGPFGPGATMVPFQGMRQGGMMQGPYQGPASWTGAWTQGPAVDLSTMPMFYQQRLGPMQMGADGRWGRRSFTDPAIILGGGVRLNLTDRLYVRPQARALIVMADGRRHRIGTFTMGFGLTF